MKVLYGGKDRTGRKFTITTTSNEREDRLHLKCNVGNNTKDYVFLSDPAERQLEWNVTKCKKVENDILTGKRRLLKYNGAHAVYCAIGRHTKDGDEYAWLIPYGHKWSKQVKAGQWIYVDTQKGQKRVYTTKVLPVIACTEKPERKVLGICYRQDYTLFTREEAVAYAAKIKEEQSGGKR